MRWLLLKDLQILRRSPLLVSLLVIYPIAIAVLIGFALSGGPDKPKVAFLNLVPDEAQTFSIGGEKLSLSRYTNELFKVIDPILVDSRATATEKVRTGEALGALIVPADATERLETMINLSGGPPPTVEVFYNAEDPLKREYVESTIEKQLADANRALSDRLTQVSARYLDIIVSGGEFNLLGQSFSVLGLRKSDTILRATIQALDKDDPSRAALEQVARFARLASDNLDLSEPILSSIGTPVADQADDRQGRQHVDRFVRGRGRDHDLADVRHVADRVGHAGARARGACVQRAWCAGWCRVQRCWPRRSAWRRICALAVTVAMLIGLLALFVEIDWGRLPCWLRR